MAGLTTSSSQRLLRKNSASDRPMMNTHTAVTDRMSRSTASRFWMADCTGPAGRTSIWG